MSISSNLCGSVQCSCKSHMWARQYARIHGVFQGVHGSLEPGCNKRGVNWFASSVLIYDNRYSYSLVNYEIQERARTWSCSEYFHQMRRHSTYANWLRPQISQSLSKLSHWLYTVIIVHYRFTVITDEFSCITFRACTRLKCTLVKKKCVDGETGIPDCLIQELAYCR